MQVTLLRITVSALLQNIAEKLSIKIKQGNVAFYHCLVYISNLCTLCRHICLIKLTPALLLVVLQDVTLQCHMRQCYQNL